MFLQVSPMATRQSPSVTEKKATEFKKLFGWFGVDLRQDHGTQLIGDCPFCGKEDHFFVGELTGQWDCKVCGESGNHFSFFQKRTTLAAQETTPEKWKRLEDERGIPAEAYQAVGAGFLEEKNQWMIPMWSDKGTVRDVRMWSLGGPLQSPNGSHLQLAGLDDLASPEANRESDTVRIWVCEGEHDWVAMKWLLGQAGSTDLVVGVPGANTLKKEWVPWFQECHIIICSDNDSAGDEMQLKWQERLSGIARRIQFLNWPVSRPEGYDLRDFIAAGRGSSHSAQSGIIALEQLLSDSPRCTPLGPIPDGTTPETVEREPLQTIAFDELLDVFRRHVKVSPEFEQALAVAAATCLSGAMPSDPIWVYLVGQAGVGKTLILNGFKASTHVHYESTIKRTSLISGFDKGADNSLLPRLHNKTAIFKDGTELLAMPLDARNEVFGTLRGAFDGSYSHNFGNGLHRKYICHFNCLVGVTNAIRATTQDQLGERFLRFEMKEKDPQLVIDKMWAAQNSIRTIQEEDIREKEMVAAGTAFLSRKVPLDNLPKISDDDYVAIQFMSMMISMLRATVARDRKGEEMLYRPDSEAPTRACKQLTKLAHMLAFALNKPQVDKYCMDILRKMAYDTCIDFNVDIVRTLYRLPGNGGMNETDLIHNVKVDSITLQRRLSDMIQLGVVRKQITDRPGLAGKVAVYYLEADMVTAWEGCL